MLYEHVDYIRMLYAFLSVVCATGFVTTLVVRWDDLHMGERILRFGLIIEHLVLTYGGYVALTHDLPPSVVGLLLTGSMVVIILGFMVWLADALISTESGLATRSGGYTQPKEADMSVAMKEIDVDGTPVEVIEQAYSEDPDGVVASVRRAREKHALTDVTALEIQEIDEDDDFDEDDEELDPEHEDEEIPNPDEDDELDVDEDAPLGDYEGGEDDE